MFDMSHIPKGARVWSVSAPSAAYGHLYQVPREASFVSFLVIAPGGGGGGGCGGGAGAGKGGGGGGAASCAVFATVPAAMLPRKLSVYMSAPGAGGAGGSSGSGAAGAVPGSVYVLQHTVYAAGNVLLSANLAGGTAAGGGTSGAGGAGGTAPPVDTIAGQPLLQWALSYRFVAGNAGAAGGTGNAAGGAITIGTGLPILGGAGGGGCTSADQLGGAINALANSPFGASAGGPAGGGAGSSGFRHGNYPMIYGGTGGGSSNSTTGGQGGDAGPTAWGAGGGGGGAGVTVGGRGGNGGPGLVVIAAW